MGRIRPVLLTLRVLFGRRPDHSPVGLVACFRPSTRPLSWTGWPARQGGRRSGSIWFCALTGEAVTGLVAEAASLPSRPRPLAQVSGPAGNPLFVLELLGAVLAQEGTITTAGGRAGVAEMVLPPTLRTHRPFATKPRPRAYAGAAVRRHPGIRVLAHRPGHGSPAPSPWTCPSCWLEAIRAPGGRRRRRTAAVPHELIRDAIYETPACHARQPCTVRPASGWPRKAGGTSSTGRRALARGAPLPGDPEAVAWLGRRPLAAPRSPDVAGISLGRAVGADGHRGIPAATGLLAERASSLSGRAHRRRRTSDLQRRLLGRDLDPSLEGCGPGMPQARPAIGWTARDSLCELERHASRPCSPPPSGPRPRRGRASPGCDCRTRRVPRSRRGEARSAVVSARDHAATKDRHGLARCGFELGDTSKRPYRSLTMLCCWLTRAPASWGHRYPVHIPRGYILVALDRLDEARTTIETGRRISEE